MAVAVPPEKIPYLLGAGIQGDSRTLFEVGQVGRNLSGQGLLDHPPGGGADPLDLGQALLGGQGLQASRIDVRQRSGGPAEGADLVRLGSLAFEKESDPFEGVDGGDHSPTLSHRRPRPVPGGGPLGRHAPAGPTGKPAAPSPYWPVGPR